MKPKAKCGMVLLICGLLAGGCGGQKIPPEKPVQSHSANASAADWDAAMRRALRSRESSVEGEDPGDAAAFLPAVLCGLTDAENAADLAAVTWTEDGVRDGTLRLHLVYDAAPQELERRGAWAAAYAAGFAEGCRMLPPEVCALLAHDAVLRRCSYAAEGGGSAYAALNGGEARCAGYAAAFRLLCGAAGIPCETVTGTVRSSTGGEQPHAWNIVTLGGSRYHVDCTWDDRAGRVLHTWFLRSDAEMAATHAWDRQGTAAASGGALSYTAIVTAMQ